MFFSCSSVDENIRQITKVAVETPIVTITNATEFINTPFTLILPSITMSPLENEKALTELLRTNGNCVGKCLGGIYPDIMIISDAVNVMSQWGMIRIGKNSQGKTFLNLTQNQLNEHINVYLSVGTWAKELETIDRVSIRLEGTSNSNFIPEDVWLDNKDAFEGFRIDNILKAYGVPSYIGLFFETVEINLPLEGRNISYSLAFHYEELNLLVGIGGLAYYDGQNLFLCPSKDPHNLGIEIYPEISLESRQSFYPITWQELTETDLNTFYYIFTSENAFDECIITTLQKIQVLQPSFR